MKNIEKLLEVFPMGLHIRHESVASEEEKNKSEVFYTHATPEAKEAFRQALEEHLLRKLERCRIGESITYDYFLGTVRNATSPESKGASVLSINPNLQEVMDNLPELPEGESYVFPAQTAVSIKVIGFAQDEIVTSFEKVSSWLKEAMQ